MKYADLYRKGKETLYRVGIAESELDARLLLEYICHTDRNDLLVHGDREVSSEDESKYLEWINKRASHIPLQYITGVQEFMGLEFDVNEHVLIPRQDTEILVEEIMKDLHDGTRILDMCTGSGCILISLLSFSNDCEGVGVDISTDALDVAKSNADKLLSLKQDATKFSFVASDLFACFYDIVEKGEEVEKFDVIVSNPPYICSDVIPTLMEEVRLYEPIRALDGAEDGLFFYRKITEQSRRFLQSGGKLFYEIGYDQGEAVKEIMEASGFKDIKVVKDFAGLDRVVYGRL